MTERLYYADSYLKRFEATLTACEAQGGRVYLDRTAFYPTSGGQPFDTGTLRATGRENAEPLLVVDVVDEGDKIAHVVEGAGVAAFVEGTQVHAEINWPRRFDHMQQHSGQHLLSALFHEMFGMATSSVHFGTDASTLDLDVSSVSPEQVRAVEERANVYVCENLPVSAAMAPQAPPELRKSSSRQGPLRVVRIEGLDHSACGGTHVARTGEIGPILLRKLDRVRKSVRIEFLCGQRATRRARADFEILSDLARGANTSIAGLREAFAARALELRDKTTELEELRAALDEYRARELYEEALDSTGSSGIVLGHVKRTSGSLQDVKGMAQQYATLPRAALIVTVEDPAAVLLATAESSGIDAGALLKRILSKSEGRGGGSARLAQGTVRDRAALETAVRELREELLGTRSAAPGAP